MKNFARKILPQNGNRKFCIISWQIARGKQKQRQRKQPGKGRKVKINHIGPFVDKQKKSQYADDDDKYTAPAGIILMTVWAQGVGTVIREKQ